MTQSAYQVGYGRPPQHTRFQKGQSGNPSGRAGPARRLLAAFDAALNDALSADKKALLESKPTRVIEAFARAVVVDALDGRASAQRIVFARLDRAVADAPAQEEGVDTGDYSLAIRSAFAEAPASAPRAPSDKPADKPADEQARVPRQAQVPGQARDADEESGEDERFVYDDESTRQRLGDRYSEFKARFERAVNANDLDALAELAKDFDDEKPP